MQSLRILVVAERVPRRDESSGDGRFAALLEMLGKRHHVDLWAERASETDAVPAGVNLLGSGWRFLEHAVSSRSYDLAFFEFYFAAERYAPVVVARQPRVRVIVDTVDVHFARLQAGVSVGACTDRQVSDMRERELRQYRAADAVFVVSREDADVLSAADPTLRIEIVPNLVARTARADVRREPLLLFVGHFDHAPNRDGLHWFVESSWETIRRARPDATVLVIGSRITPDIAALSRVPGVETLGRVPDVLPYLDRAAVSIAPLRYGAGMKGKVGDAMAAGVPVVTTSIGAQGLNARSGEHLIVADTADDFARGVLTLLDDPAACRRIGLAGQELVGALCDPGVVGDGLERALAAATLGRRAAPTPPAATSSMQALARARIGHQVRWLRRRARALLHRDPA